MNIAESKRLTRSQGTIINYYQSSLEKKTTTVNTKLNAPCSHKCANVRETGDRPEVSPAAAMQIRIFDFQFQFVLDVGTVHVFHPSSWNLPSLFSLLLSSAWTQKISGKEIGRTMEKTCMKINCNLKSETQNEDFHHFPRRSWLVDSDTGLCALQAQSWTCSLHRIQ